jgi:hypothetical protein
MYKAIGGRCNVYFTCDYCGNNEYYDNEEAEDGFGWIRMFEDPEGKTVCEECLAGESLYLDWWELSQKEIEND